MHQQKTVSCFCVELFELFTMYDGNFISYLLNGCFQLHQTEHGINETTFMQTKLKSTDLDFEKSKGKLDLKLVEICCVTIDFQWQRIDVQGVHFH